MFAVNFSTQLQSDISLSLSCHTHKKEYYNFNVRKKRHQHKMKRCMTHFILLTQNSSSLVRWSTFLIWVTLLEARSKVVSSRFDSSPSISFKPFSEIYSCSSLHRVWRFSNLVIRLLYGWIYNKAKNDTVIQKLHQIFKPT